MGFGIKIRPHGEDTAQVPDSLPWGQAEASLALIDPPKPLLLRLELSEEDVAQIQASGARNKLTVPAALILLVYFGLKTIYGDALPDILLYGLLGGTFILNALLASRRAKDHYARPGSMSVTVSMDGVEVSSEHWAGHIPWTMIKSVERTEQMTVLQTLTTPAFHALPLRTLSPAEVQSLDVWMEFARLRRPKPRGRALAYIALALVAGLVALWVWDQLGRPLPPL